MSRTERLTLLLQSLRRRTPPVQAQLLADEFNISLRSVYRDIDTLRHQGAIIDGEAGFGYTFIEDGTIPPQSFTSDEIEAVLLGLHEIVTNGDPTLAQAAQNARAKIRASLPVQMHNHFDHNISMAYRFQPRPAHNINMDQLRLAIRQEIALDLHYQAPEQNISVRRIYPLTILYADQVLLLISWCKLREDFRSFRLDRIVEMHIAEESFRPHRTSFLRKFHETRMKEKKQDKTTL